MKTASEKASCSSLPRDAPAPPDLHSKSPAHLAGTAGAKRHRVHLVRFAAAGAALPSPAYVVAAAEIAAVGPVRVGASPTLHRHRQELVQEGEKRGDVRGKLGAEGLEGPGVPKDFVAGGAPRGEGHVQQQALVALPFKNWKETKCGRCVAMQI